MYDRSYVQCIYLTWCCHLDWCYVTQLPLGQRCSQMKTIQQLHHQSSLQRGWRLTTGLVVAANRSPPAASSIRWNHCSLVEICPKEHLGQPTSWFGALPLRRMKHSSVSFSTQKVKLLVYNFITPLQVRKLAPTKQHYVLHCMQRVFTLWQSDKQYRQPECSHMFQTALMKILTILSTNLVSMVMSVTVVHYNYCWPPGFGNGASVAPTASAILKTMVARNYWASGTLKCRNDHIKIH